MSKLKIIRRAIGIAASVWLVCLGGLPLLAQTAEENLFFDAAARAFQHSVDERAEKQFAEFVEKYPQSVRLPEAILFQARAALKQEKFQQAAGLLTTNFARAGLLADQYRYWLADSYLQSSNYQAAAAAFAQLIKEFPSSVRLLEASYQEASARFKLGQLPQVIELLQNPEGTFQREAKTRLSDELVLRGYLLLGEALLEQKSYLQAEQTMGQLGKLNLTPEFNWERQRLLVRTHMAQKRFSQALLGATNLLNLAGASGRAALQAQSLAIQGGIFEQLGQFDAAIEAFTNNLAATAPVEYRRGALLKIIQLMLAQDRIADAAQRLDLFLGRYPEDSSSDAVLLTLGEVYLKQYDLSLQTSQTNSASAPAIQINNLLRQAAGCFDRLLTNFPQSAFYGQAHLGRGWCYWQDGKIAESQVAFKLAADKLPHSEEQAVARFKLADTFYWQKDFTNALRHYRAVFDEYSDVPRVKSVLGEPALYQWLRAGLELQDTATAAAAMQQILASYPNSSSAERSQLLLGQAFARGRKAAEARMVLQDFSRKYPGSPLLPRVELAVARTYVQEQAWDSALQVYDLWLQRFATNTLKVETEFNRAWAHYMAGRETNALRLFTNFVAEYKTNELAPYARNWVADFYFRQNNFPEAEYHYQLLFRDWPAAPLANQARMMAGRAAFARQAYKSAEEYFQSIVNDNEATNLWAEALYGLGDTILMSDADPTNPIRKFDEAKKAFRRILQLFPNDRLGALAWGRIGDCYFQMGSQDPKYYDSAVEAYQQVLTPTNYADIKARSQAEVGWAKVLERQAQTPDRTSEEKNDLLKAALNHYLNVFEGKILKKDEKLDPFWLKEAGFGAAALAEEQKQWETCFSLYKRLQDLFPVYRSALEKKMDKAREQLRPEKS